MSDLGKLIEAVEAGAFLMDALPDGRTERLAYESFGGSLDAAMQLHEALLPGHTRAVDATAPEMGIRVELWSPEGPIVGTGDNASEARAWLLAILKALRAKEAVE
ncbi:MAG: hypothetical protein ACLGIP_18150 [Alphaproteobacteria bacterium]